MSYVLRKECVCLEILTTMTICMEWLVIHRVICLFSVVLLKSTVHAAHQDVTKFISISRNAPKSTRYHGYDFECVEARFTTSNLYSQSLCLLFVLAVHDKSPPLSLFTACSTITIPFLKIKSYLGCLNKEFSKTKSTFACHLLISTSKCLYLNLY